MKNVIMFILFTVIMVSCSKKEQTDPKTYFLSYIDRLPDKNIQLTDSLSQEQRQVMAKYNLGVSIPANFKSVIDDKDKECFIFYNASDSSILLARCFESNDSVINQIDRSTKFDNPEYGDNYNDLSEFPHFKSCEKLLTDSLIGPFLFGGFFYELLGADNVMHQGFFPKSKKYQFGEFKLLFDDKKYLIVCSLHNGYSENLDDNPRWQAFRFISPN
ncbi:MAG: hypothetical protein FGM46_04140 [Ferruginibacter sp.]|nr:hypothetical protein [Ferruginibacter sp.]